MIVRKCIRCTIKAWCVRIIIPIRVFDFIGRFDSTGRFDFRLAIYIILVVSYIYITI